MSQENRMVARPNASHARGMEALFKSDCLNVLKRLPTQSAQLIYLDPPFFTNRCFVVNQSKAFDDKWPGGIKEYLNWISPRLVESKRVLKRRGSIFIHCDYHASHYLKVLADEIFGYDRFVNEIIWKRQSAHNDTAQGARHLGRIHDTILLYSKSQDYTWNYRYEPYARDYINKYYRFVDAKNGRRFALGDLSAPGGPTKHNPFFEFMGIKRYWRYSKRKLEKMYDEDKIYYSGPGRVPLLKRYLDEMNGLGMQDIWLDVWTKRQEDRCGYPTSKPLSLLERIIRLSTNPGDVVLDPFCGSGSTLLASHRLGRHWIGVDISELAVNMAAYRLRAAGARFALFSGHQSIDINHSLGNHA